MSGSESRTLNADHALRAIAESTAAATGEVFFRALVQSLAGSLDTLGAWVTQYVPDERTLKGLAFWLGDGFLEGYQTRIDGTPCAQVVEGRRMVHVPERLFELYPADEDVRQTGAVSYLGVPLLDTDGTVLGHLAVMDHRPLAADPRLLAVFEIFAARAAAEHKRLAAEARLREREEKLARVIDTAMDAIVDLDAELVITSANPAAERVFGCGAAKLVGRAFTELLTASAAKGFLGHADALAGRAGGGAVWLPEPLDARRVDGERFSAEASLTRYALRGRPCHTLILRDVADRVRAERTIRHLRDELRDLREGDRILGESPAVRAVLRDVGQVAGTGASVLILGETGTGKELVARAIHEASPRRDRPLVRVNCAAIPGNLMESEFFGHEKGAFTGATQKRDGRFLLADGGTLFLDEVGELPLDLQVKLLRALQEGEFEPVGGNRTLKVDVRVIAATNRDLAAAARQGSFREDLYYRLNVFPIRLPPLRERADDIDLLARAFTARAAARAGRRIEPPGADDLRRLRAYAWPGNVRELENVIERAAITSTDGRLNLDRALPETSGRETRPDPTPGPSEKIRTAADLELLERGNLLRALRATQWRIAGAGGAAELLGMNPSTLRSRMKALNVDRPNA